MSVSSRRSFPIFVNPSELNYFIESKKTHTQILTLYNPYDFPVKYQVLSNTHDRKYTVIDPKGTIASQSSVDLIFKHHETMLSNTNTKDTFLIKMCDAKTKELIGKRYIIARLYASGEPDNSSSESQHFDDVASSQFSQNSRDNQKPDPSTRKILIAIWCLILLALFLPTTVPEPQFFSNLPAYMQLSAELKIFLSFILGLLSMYLLWV